MYASSRFHQDCTNLQGMSLSIIVPLYATTEKGSLKTISIREDSKGVAFTKMIHIFNTAKYNN